MSERAPFKPSENLIHWVDLLKSFAEIAAIIVGAYWTYTRFIIGEAPSLVVRAQLQARLQWVDETPTHCSCKLSAVLKNIGKTTFSIDSIQVSMWIKPEPELSARISLLDPETITKGKADTTFYITENSLLGKYTPDYSLMDEYYLTVPKNSKKLAFVKIVAKGSAIDNKEDTLRLYDYGWASICEKDAVELEKYSLQ